MFFCFLGFFLFFFVFFRPSKNMRQPFSGMAERIFMKLLSNDTGEMEFTTSCRRLANDSKLVYAGLCWFGIVTAVTLKRHERVNAFNLVLL